MCITSSRLSAIICRLLLLFYRCQHENAAIFGPIAGELGLCALKLQALAGLPELLLLHICGDAVHST